MRREKKEIKSSGKPFNHLLPLISIFIATTFFASSSFYQESWNFDWSEIRTEVKDSILFYEHHPITSGVGGEGISTADEVKRRIWIMKNGTIKELSLLIHYPDGNVKAIAYEGLLRKPDYPDKKELTLQALIDLEYKVAYQSGCLGWDMSLGVYIVREVLHLDDTYPPPPPSSNSDIGLSDADKLEILEAYSKIRSN